MSQQLKRHKCSRCSPHEREWRGHCVDMNLEDPWLKSLNALIALDLISICEGHVTGGRGVGSQSPHINLRIKDRVLPNVVQTYDCHSDAIRLLLSKVFNDGCSNVETEFRIRMCLSRRRESIDRDLTVRISATHQRTSTALDDVSRQWFTNSVNRVQTLDSEFAKLFSAIILPSNRT